MGRADFPRNGRLVVHVWSDTISDDAPVGFTTIVPRTGKVDGERRHKFCIPGITFILFLGGLAPARHDEGVLNSARGRFMWLTPFADDLRQRSPDLPAHLSDRSRGRVRFWRRTGAPARRWPEENRRIRPLAGGLARQRTLITTVARIVGDSRRFLVLAGGRKPPTAP